MEQINAQPTKKEVSSEFHDITEEKEQTAPQKMPTITLA